MKKYIEVVVAQPDGGFADGVGKVNRLLFPGDIFEHFEKFKGGEPSHWCLGVGKSVQQSVLLFDIDAIERPEKPFSGMQQKWLDPIIRNFKLEPAECGLNWTGFGFHLYVFFDQTFDVRKESWLYPLVDKTDLDLKKLGWKLDRKILSPRQFIRAAGTTYLKKRGKDIIGPYSTTILKKPKKKRDWLEYKKMFCKVTQGKEKKEEKISENWLKEDWDWDTITGRTDPAKGCRFLKWAYFNQEKLDYSEWLAQLSLVSKYNKDEAQSLDFARSFSCKSSKYNEREFYGKFKEARYKLQPMTCRRIRKIWKESETMGGCGDCPHRKLNMPLRIRLYSSQDTGFRLQGPKGPKNIDFSSLCDYSNKELFVQAESDETLYQYNKEKFWEPIPFTEFSSRYKWLIKPQIKPSELSGWEKYLKHHSVFKLEDELRKTKDKIFFRNCILDTQSMKIEEAENIRYKNFYRLGFDYDENAKAPLYEKLLDKTFKDNDIEREYFLQYMAMALFSNSFYDKAMILVGDGSNGKSSIMDGISQLFGPESAIIMPFTVDQLKRDETHHHYIRKARVAYLSDSEGMIISKDRNLFKRLISGEKFSYRLKYSRSLVFYQIRAKFVIGMNDIPIINEGSEGIRRRFIFLSFKNRVWLPDIHPEYSRLIGQEKAGIFNILIKNLIKWRENKKFPETSKKTLDTSIMLGDIKQAFWSSCVKVTGDGTDLVNSMELYGKFKDFVSNETMSGRSCSRRMLTEWILRKKVDKNDNITSDKKNGIIAIRGIRLDGLSENQSDTAGLPI